MNIYPNVLFLQNNFSSSKLKILALLALPSRAVLIVALILSFSGASYARDTYDFSKAKLKQCPEGWVESSAPGGCSPEYFTMKFSGIEPTQGCPSGWVESSAPGGCSPGFFTLLLNKVRDSRRSCPDGWVRSSAPGGCSPGFITLKQAELRQLEINNPPII